MLDSNGEPGEEPRKNLFFSVLMVRGINPTSLGVVLLLTEPVN